MAKNKPPSKHSRAARRATSPSINTDKSLKEISPPRKDPAPRPSVLAVHRAAGVQKKKGHARGSKGKMSAKARRRHERGLEMAEAIMERTSEKVKRSQGNEKKVRERRKAWEDINKAADGGEDGAGTGAGAGEGQDEGWEETDEEVDLERDDQADEIDGVAERIEGVTVQTPQANGANKDHDDDEIL